jgi:hypothetical protein
MRSATLAIRSKLPPSVTPARFVFTSPVTLRYSAGAVILGSNVSTCVGPPLSQSQITEVSLVDEPAAAAAARVRRRLPRPTPAPRPSVPTRRKSRRDSPAQFPNRRSCRISSMANSSAWAG